MASYPNTYHGSFRTGRDNQSLPLWVMAAVITSALVHGGLFVMAQHFEFKGFLGGASPQEERDEQLKFRLERAKIHEETTLDTPPTPTKPIEEKPFVEEPPDLTQFKMDVTKELSLTPKVDVPTNVTLSRKPAAGVDGSPVSQLSEVPTRVDTESLANQLNSLGDKLVNEPRISPDQVKMDLRDLSGPDSDLLKDTVSAAAKRGTGRSGDDGFDSLDDLLNYKGPVTEDKKAMMPTDLLFEYGSAELRDSARLSLMKLGFIIQRNPTAEISIEGHTDTFGGDEYNQSLSLSRAEAVKAWLVESLHLAAERLGTRGWGKGRLLVGGGSVDQQAKNRRVEIVIRPRR